MFLFELTSLGSKFAFTRLAINIPGFLLIAYSVKALLKEEDIKKMYENAINF